MIGPGFLTSKTNRTIISEVKNNIWMNNIKKVNINNSSISISIRNINSNLEKISNGRSKEI